MTRFVILLIGVCLFLVSCAGFFGRPAERVVFAVESVDVDSDIITEGAGMLGTILDILTGKPSQRKTDMPLTITMRVRNTNDFAIDITRITYDLRVNDYDFGRGEHLLPKGTLRIEPDYERIVRLPINVPYTKVMERVIKGLYKEEVTVFVRGEATAQYKGGDFVSPFTAEKSKVRLFR
ncbi:MAG: LEA type 2 family protein [Thermodesulfovibrionales bacterium]|nr:LEA type 2 family protein [Thermodesulfovibrionales bacterium]